MSKKRNQTPYPEMIIGLPEIDIPLEGIKGWAIQGKNKQVVFFDIQPVSKVPPHSHCSQWGLVLGGKMRLIIGEESKVYGKGDCYFIPEGVVHSATFLTRVYVIDVFDDPNRYKIKC
jgi:quercetin dioxygenase-like cupin family protein